MKSKKIIKIEYLDPAQEFVARAYCDDRTSVVLTEQMIMDLLKDCLCAGTHTTLYIDPNSEVSRELGGVFN